jgi:hypothetical protein
MKRRFGEHLLGAVAALVLVTMVAVAATHTWETTAVQDRVIHKMLTMENARRASKGQSAITTEQFVQGMTTRLWTQQWRKVRRRLLRKAGDAALNDLVDPRP